MNAPRPGQKQSLRILWVKLGGLWPPNVGGRVRTFRTLEQLSRRHRLSLVTTHAPHEDPGPLPQALPDCTEVSSLAFAAPKVGSREFVTSLLRSWASRYPVDLWRWRVPQLRRLLAERMERERFDVCVADFLTALPNLPAMPGIPLVLFEHNVEHHIWRRLAGSERRPWARLPLAGEWRKMRMYERQACRMANLTLTVSRHDQRALQQLAPGSRIEAVPTGVDTDYFVPSSGPQQACHLVFTGAMDWYPNEEGMRWFLSTIWPRVRADFPEVTLTVVGRNPAPAFRAFADAEGAYVTGTVDDIRPHVWPATVYVVPIRIGGGTRLKIFEAMAMGKAVVSTRVGAEGLPIRPETHYLCADSAADFAAAIGRLLRDVQKRARLEAAGRRLVVQHHSWPHVAADFETRLRSVLH